MNAVEKMQMKIDESLERKHQEEFKDVARAMEDTEKYIVLKTIPTEVLIGEISKRMQLLESRDKAIKELFRIPEE
jgi:hypothetical protein